MRHLRRLLLRFYQLFATSKSEADLAKEISAHLSFLEDEYVRDGMTPEQARLAARRAYGGVEQAKQLHRNERMLPSLAQIPQDVRYTLRQLRKSPGFAATAILMLSLGIGATTAIFSIVEGVLLRPLPFPDPARLVTLGDVLEGSHCDGCTRTAVTAPDIRNYMRDTQTFAHLGGYQRVGFELSSDGQPQAVRASRMSGDVFAALGVSPLLGRVFTQQEDEQHQPIAVLSYGLWQSRFRGDANIVGSKILLDRTPYIVAGVMPREFEFPLGAGHLTQSELWVPLSPKPEEFTAGHAASWNLRMVGRLKPGVTVAQAQSDAQRVAIETMRGYPAYMSSLRIRAVVTPLHDDVVQEARPLVRTLFLAVSVVLLIACANLAGLLLVRSIRRRREIAVRLAMGARAASLLQQAIVESMVLSIAGGAIGLGLAASVLRIGVSLLPETLPRVHQIGLNWPVGLFALGLALLTGFVCALAPSFVALKGNANETLKEGGRTGTQARGHARLRSTLVVAEVAVALILLTASGLLLRSFDKMRKVDLGFKPDHTLAAIYELPHDQYRTQSAIDTFCDALLENIRRLPAVEFAGVTELLPAGGNGPGIAFTMDGYVPPKGAGLNMAEMSMVRGDPFQALGVRLLRGRVFTEADKADTQLVAIVSRRMAERYWPGQNPIGKRLRRGMPETATPWMTVVGEVDDVKLGSPDTESTPQVYQPVRQTVISEGAFATAGELSGADGWIVLRSSLPPEQMENLLRDTLRRLDPQLPLYHVQSMEHAISSSEAPRRFHTLLIASFAAAAVLLSVLGIYAVIAFSVVLREQEIAVRMALGCQRSGVLLLILKSGLQLALAGCGLGLLGAAAISHLLRSLLFDVSPFDPGVLAISVLAMLLLSLAASALPATRAMRSHPITALGGD